VRIERDWRDFWESWVSVDGTIEYEGGVGVQMVSPHQSIVYAIMRHERDC
jgi:hypothetical protein